MAWECLTEREGGAINKRLPTPYLVSFIIILSGSAVLGRLPRGDQSMLIWFFLRGGQSSGKCGRIVWIVRVIDGRVGLLANLGSKRRSDVHFA